MIPLRRLYNQLPAKGLAEDERFLKPGPSHRDELAQRVYNAEEQAKLSAHLQLNRDRRMGFGVPSLTETVKAQMLGPLAGISSNLNSHKIDTSKPFWNRQYGFKGNNGSKVNLRGSVNKPPEPASAGPSSSNLRGTVNQR